MSTEHPHTEVWTQDRFGGPEVLVTKERPLPLPGDGEVLLRVRAVGVNASDWLARSGVAPSYGQPPFTLGRDVSGVVAVGAGVSRFRPGNEVFGMIGGGGCAVHVTAPAALTA
ncbi:alcohol dehydrogenase catalytic domain-containing protein [Streptomyces canus]|uniref:alcohol dehydrogenase catalytic domain-containing protein n=1 Tax=Streptomyces canus TaxID=58343 RepID=UPI00386E5649